MCSVEIHEIKQHHKANDYPRVVLSIESAKVEISRKLDVVRNTK